MKNIDPRKKGLSSEEFIDSITRYKKYENNIPRAGAVVINETFDKVLGIYGSTSHKIFAFPKGKRNENEVDLYDTACREVREEAGIDIKPYSSPNMFYEMQALGSLHVFYVCNFKLAL